MVRRPAKTALIVSANVPILLAAAGVAFLFVRVWTARCEFVNHLRHPVGTPLCCAVHDADMDLELLRIAIEAAVAAHNVRAAMAAVGTSMASEHQNHYGWGTTGSERSLVSKSGWLLEGDFK